MRDKETGLNRPASLYHLLRIAKMVVRPIRDFDHPVQVFLGGCPDGFCLGQVFFKLEVTDQRYQRESRITGMVEWTGLVVVTPEISFIAQTPNQVFRTILCHSPIRGFFRGVVEFHGCKESRIIVNDVFYLVIAVFASSSQSLLTFQMVKAFLGSS